MQRNDSTKGNSLGLPQVPVTLGKIEKRERVVIWITMIVGIALTAVAFVYKVAEFLFTLGSSDVQGFADVPVTVYFVVAAGWLSLLVWCFVSGKFTDVERAKYEMLELEEEYERRGE